MMKRALLLVGILLCSGAAIAKEVPNGEGEVACSASSGGVKNLISREVDDSSGVVWSNIQSAAVGAGAQSDTDGASNTVAIINQKGHASSAAKICSDLIEGGHSDWYLPAKDELNCLYQNQDAISSFGERSGYWSSTENGASSAWSRPFNAGDQPSTSKGAILSVRCVRAYIP